MRRLEKDMTIGVKENFLGGEGTTTIRKYINPDEFGGAGRMFAQFVISVGGSIGVHEHKGEQEVYHITEGKGEYTDNGEVYEVGVGDTLACFDGGSHGIKNIGDCELKYTALITFTK